MKNNKGFTLTEVLLAAMIVGIIGVALAALTTAALRESGSGRTRQMLRNQISLFLRQLRQDAREATSITVSVDKQNATFNEGQPAGSGLPVEVTYNCHNDVCKRGSETVLNHVSVASFEIDKDYVSSSEESTVSGMLHVYLIVGVDGNPPVKEVVDEIFVLPQGVATKKIGS